MHLVSTTEVTAAGPRWANASRATAAVPLAARAIAIGLERSTVIVIESRDGQRAGPGEVLRTRHVGMVRMLAGDGMVLARRRLASTQGSGEALIPHLLDEVRASVVAAPHLVVGLVQDAGDATWDALQGGLSKLAEEKVIANWYEAIDRGALRSRLDRTLCVIEPDALAREERLDHWDMCLDAWDDAIDGVAAFLRTARDQSRHPATVDAQLHWLADHRERMRYARLRSEGLCLRPALGDEGIGVRQRIPREAA